MRSRILVATDFSPASRPAFKQAIALAKANRAPLEILHVVTPIAPVVGDGYVSPKIYDELMASTRAWVRKQMAALAKTARAAGVKPVTTAIREGVAAEQIVRVARARRPHMVVMGTHGRTGFSRLLLGSVASRVVSSAPCPVLTVRGR